VGVQTAHKQRLAAPRPAAAGGLLLLNIHTMLFLITVLLQVVDRINQQIMHLTSCLELSKAPMKYTTPPQQMCAPAQQLQPMCQHPHSYMPLFRTVPPMHAGMPPSTIHQVQTLVVPSSKCAHIATTPRPSSKQPF
jgi:hypothetical protein